jgi:hypothetical protein
VNEKWEGRLRMKEEWVEEFYSWAKEMTAFKRNSRHWPYYPMEFGGEKEEIAYLAARQKGQEEIDRLNRLLALETERAQKAETQSFWLMKEKVEIREKVERAIAQLKLSCTYHVKDSAVMKALAVLTEIGEKE